MERLFNHQTIDEFLLDITETAEYKRIEYLIFSIRMNYLHYMDISRIVKFEIPKYLENLIGIVIDKFNESGISTVDMLQYMLDNDINNWIHYYAYTFIIPVEKGEENEAVNDLSELYAFVLTGYILDTFREKRIDIKNLVEGQVLAHKTNQYDLTVVDGVEFKRDYFVFEGKAYLYSILTNTNTMRFGDTMPAFARIITEQVKDGNILLRLDERLALPINQAISYSTLNFEKYRGPQFHFKDSILKNPKTITIHIDENTADKLLLVVKKKVDNNSKKDFWHIELETLPYRDTASKGKYCITTFLHGMYYPEDDCFTHIDCTKNQYEMSEYIKKYSECEPDIPVDLHTKSNELHYKIWCIENGRYTREVWYNLMTASLNEKYRTLLDEILA
ncbi:MAG: hypothetical protein ACLTWZ_12105 [Coprococcus sp.]